MGSTSSRRVAVCGAVVFWVLAAAQAVGFLDFGMRGFVYCVGAGATSALALVLIDVLAALAAKERRLAYRLGRAEERQAWLDDDEPTPPPLYLVR